MKIESLNKRGIPYIIKETKQHKIILSVKKDGTIVIKKHRFISMDKVINFVDQHLYWIEKAYLNHYNPPRKYITGEEYLLLGKTLHLQVTFDKSEGIEADFDYQILYIHTNDNSVAHIKKLIENYLLRFAEEVFTVLFENALTKLEPPFEINPVLYIKQYKSRWGCCIPKENKIILNRSLIHVDLDLISFVIFHELCHFQFLNHSPEFHQALMHYVPNERELRKRLNKYSPEYN